MTAEAKTSCDLCRRCGAYLYDDARPCPDCNGGLALEKRAKGKKPWRNRDYAEYERQRAERAGFKHE